MWILWTAHRTYAWIQRKHHTSDRASTECQLFSDGILTFFKPIVQNDDIEKFANLGKMDGNEQKVCFPAGSTTKHQMT